MLRKQANKDDWPVSHLKSFYTELFLRVPIKDLMFPEYAGFFIE